MLPVRGDVTPRILNHCTRWPCDQIHFAVDFPTHTPLGKALQLIKVKRQSGPLRRFGLCGKQRNFTLLPAWNAISRSASYCLSYYTDCITKEERNDELNVFPVFN